MVKERVKNGWHHFAQKRDCVLHNKVNGVLNKTHKRGLKNDKKLSSPK
jgi:hypothetical protein